MRRLSLYADHVCGDGWEWACFFHIKLRDSSVADVQLTQLLTYTVFQAGSEFLEVSPTEFASLSAIEKSSFLDKKSKEVAGDWEVCIESRPKDQCRDAKVTYFSRFLNCMDNLPGVNKVEQKFLEQVTVLEPAVSQYSTHLVATLEHAVRTIQECRGRIDVSLGQFQCICEEVRSFQTEIAEVNVVITDTERSGGHSNAVGSAGGPVPDVLEAVGGDAYTIPKVSQVVHGTSSWSPTHLSRQLSEILDRVSVRTVPLEL
ncbi:hypothetical protein R1sor_017552 [Riccia sorocarpa]|uniref:Uncharacterized protein n=1 Tax=Riccia sorocarpa TaxID=122646 RepID=A0ABD3IAW4_9MARC